MAETTTGFGSSGLLGALGTGLGLQAAIGNVQDLRSDILNKGEQITTRAADAARFQPITVTSGSGQIGVGPTGSTTLTPTQTGVTNALQSLAAQQAGQIGASPMFGQIADTALGQAQAGLGMATPTAQTLFEQMQATRQGEQERQRLELENRLAAQGRLGTQTSAYGGTPEALAQAKAFQEQSAKDLVTAQQLAPQLAQQQLAQTQGLFNLGQQASTATPALQAAQLANVGQTLGTAFLPTQQLLETFTPAATSAQLAQSGRASTAQALGALGTPILNAMQSTGETEAGLQQAQINALLAGLGLEDPSAPKTFEDMLTDAIAGGTISWSELGGLFS